MKKRVKLTKSPSSGKHMGDQMGYGLYRGQGVRDFQQFTQNDPGTDLRTTYPESPRDKANIEVEKGEKIIARDGLSIFDVGGKKHSKGGTPVKAEPGSYVVSDFIGAPKILQAQMGFEVKSDKKKDNTWARVLDSKVKSKDYNRLSQLLQIAQSGMQVDPHELKTAQIKFPVYQDYVSKAALGGELSKALLGKEYEIPQLGMPALQKMQGQQQQGGGQQQGGIPAQPQMGVGGHVLPMYQQAPGTVAAQLKIDSNTGKVYYAPRAPKDFDLTGWNQYRSAPNDVMFYQHPGQAGSNEAGSYAGGYGVRGGGGRSRVSVDDILNHPEIYKTFHKNMAGAPDDIKKAAAYQLLHGKMPGKYIPGKTTPGEDEKYVYTQPDKEEGDGYDGGDYEDYGDDEGGSKDEGSSETYTNPYGRIPYEQDILGVAGAMRDKYAYHNVPPTQVKAQPAYIDPTFINTDAANRLMQSQARTSMEDASLYAGSPQSQGARQQQVNAQLFPSLIPAAMQTNAQNAQSAMNVAQYNNQIYNQSAQQDAAATNALIDKNANFIYNVDKSRVMADNKVQNQLSNLLSNSGNTYLMNQRYPQMAFNPLSYDVAFKQGYGKTYNDQAAASGMGGYGAEGTSFPSAQYEELIKRGMAAGDTREVAAAHAWDMIQRSQPRYRSSYNQTTGMPGPYTTSGYGGYSGGSYGGYNDTYEEGGYIPEYNVGGWF